MSSTDELVSQLSQIEELLQQLQKQTSDVRNVKKDITAAAGQLGTAGASLQNLAEQMTAAAETMRSLDMEATLTRVDQLENRIVDRSSQLSETLTESMNKLSSELSESVSELLSQMPTNIGQVIETTLKDTKQTIIDSNKTMAATFGTQLESTVDKAMTSIRDDFSDADGRNHLAVNQLVQTLNDIKGQLEVDSTAVETRLQTVEKSVLESIRKLESGTVDLHGKVIDAANVLAKGSTDAHASTRRWIKITCVFALLAALGIAASHANTILPELKKDVPSSLFPAE